jgi:hypothetical protein
MVPLSAVTKFETGNGPEFTMCYNEYRSAQIFGNAAPGYSSCPATAVLEDVLIRFGAEVVPLAVGRLANIVLANIVRACFISDSVGRLAWGAVRPRTLVPL